MLNREEGEKQDLYREREWLPGTVVGAPNLPKHDGVHGSNSTPAIFRRPFSNKADVNVAMTPSLKCLAMWEFLSIHFLNLKKKERERENTCDKKSTGAAVGNRPLCLVC